MGDEAISALFLTLHSWAGRHRSRGSLRKKEKKEKEEREKEKGGDKQEVALRDGVKWCPKLQPLKDIHFLVIWVENLSEEAPRR